MILNPARWTLRSKLLASIVTLFIVFGVVPRSAVARLRICACDNVNCVPVADET